MTKDSDWVLPCVLMLIVQHCVALALSHFVGFAERPPTISYMLMALILSTAGGLTFFLRKMWRLWKEGEDHPLGRLMSDSDWPAIWSYLLGFQLVAVQIAVLTWLKDMLPLAIPYWADEPLAALDRLALGVDAWRTIPAWLIPALEVAYPLWAFVKFIALALMLLLPASRLKAQALLAYFLTVAVLGVGGQYLLSSVGPIFYDRVVGGDEFADLTRRLEQLAPVTLATSDYLWASYLGHDVVIGNGISAMPSMHVATTTWAAMALTRFWPRCAIALWLYWIAIFIGSFALGWHYVSDSIVGAGGAVLCWKSSPALLGWFQKRRGLLKAGRQPVDSPAAGF